MKTYLLSFLMLLLPLACGGGEEQGAAPAGDGPKAGGEPKAGAEEKAGTGSASAAGFGSAVLKGSVKWEGKAPKRRKVEMDAEPYCKEHTGADVRDESTIVNENATLKNVFVWIKKGIKGKYDPPAEPFVISQTNCRYIPHVGGVMVKQKVIIRNDDPLMHNVHSVSVRRNDINYAQTDQGAENTETFRRQEVMLEFKCDVHGWMGAYFGVVKHPFFTVTGGDGSFEIGKLPAGTYTVEAWHEVWGTRTQEVTVKDGETKAIDFKFSKSK